MKNIFLLLLVFLAGKTFGQTIVFDTLILNDRGNVYEIRAYPDSLIINGNIYLKSPKTDIISVKDFGAVGDGISDDLTSISLAIQSPFSTIYFPDGNYKVSGTIPVRSNKHLYLSQAAIISLADGADTLLISNADWINGDQNITIEGGIWDGNGHNQTDKVGTGTDPDTWHGTLARFQNIEGLQISRVIVKDPNWFGIHLGKVSNFTVSNITFDYRNKGGDGLHISGLCNHGFVQNLRDPYGARDDDFVAIMSADAQVFDITPGEIHNIIVDGVFSEPTGASAVFKSGVDFLDCGAGIHDISVSNVIGEFSYIGVQFMNFGECDSRDSYIYDISLNNIDINIPDNSAMGPIVIRTDVKNLTIDGLTRKQSGDTYIPTIQIVDAHIGDLIINNVQIADSTNSGLLAFIYALDTVVIDNLTISNFSHKRLEDPASSVVVLLDQVAEIGNLNASNLYVENSSEEGLFDVRLGSGIGTLNIDNSTFVNCNILVSVNVQDQDTAYLGNLNLSNVNYTPYAGTTEVIKLLYNILDTVHIKTSNVNFNGFENNPITQYPEEDVKVRLHGFDFYVDADDLDPRRYDMVLSNAAGGPNGPVVYDGSEWVSLYEINIDTLLNELTLIKNTTIEDVDLPTAFAGGIVRFGLSPNPTAGLRAGITTGYSPYLQGVGSSSTTVPLFIQPWGGQTVFGDKDSTSNAGVVIGEDLYTEGETSVCTLKVRSLPLKSTPPSDGLTFDNDGSVKRYPWPDGIPNCLTNPGDMIRNSSDGEPECFAIGTAGQVLLSNGTIPYWGTQSIVEEDPEWISDSTDYLHKSDTNTKVATRKWVYDREYIHDPVGSTGSMIYRTALGSYEHTDGILFVDESNGKVGVGTDSPDAAATITVADNIYTGSATGSLIGQASPTSVFSTTGDVLYVGRTATAAVRSLIGMAEATVGAANGNYQGINGIVVTNGACTTNFTGSTTGGGLRNRYVISHLGSGTVTQASSVTGIINATGGNITSAAIYHAETIGVASGKTVTDGMGLWVRGGSVTGTMTNRYGVRIDDLSGGTNKWAFYQAGASDNNYFAGNIGIATTSPSTYLDINGNKFRVRTAKTPSSATDTGNAGDICWDASYIYICTATNTWKRVAISTW